MIAQFKNYLVKHQLKFVGLLNFVISLPFLYLGILSLLGWFYLPSSTSDTEFSLTSMFYATVVLLVGLVNLRSSYVLWFKKPANPSKFLLTGILFFIFCSLSLLYFISGLEFSMAFMFIFLFLAALTSVILYKHMPKTSILLFVISLLATLYFASISFEESYCWKMGEIADPSGVASLEPTEDEKAEGYSMIGVAWRVHKECHKNFQLLPTLKQELGL